MTQGSKSEEGHIAPARSLVPDVIVGLGVLAVAAGGALFHPGIGLILLGIGLIVIGTRGNEAGAAPPAEPPPG